MNLDALVETRIAPDLAALGFRRRALDFRRETSEFLHMISVSRGRQMMQGRFAITLYAHPKLTGAPGLPDLPPKPGEWWFWCRVAPHGESDRWWPNDGLSDQDAQEIRDLTARQISDWFARLDTFEHLAQDWFLREHRLEHAARELGLLPARLAYLTAVAFAELRLGKEAHRIAERALEETGPRASTLRAWIQAFRKSLKP